MIEIPGYTLTEQLYEGETSLVFRGRRKGSNGAVVLKVLKSNHPSLSELAKFRREFDMTRGLSGEGIIRAYQLENYHNSLVIVLEDFGAESLKRLITAQVSHPVLSPNPHFTGRAWVNTWQVQVMCVVG